MYLNERRKKIFFGDYVIVICKCLFDIFSFSVCLNMLINLSLWLLVEKFYIIKYGDNNFLIYFDCIKDFYLYLLNV